MIRWRGGRIARPSTVGNVRLLLLFFWLDGLVFLALIVLRFFLNREQFDLKDQGRIGPNVGARAALAIGKGSKE